MPADRLSGRPRRTATAAALGGLLALVLAACGPASGTGTGSLSGTGAAGGTTAPHASPSTGTVAPHTKPATTATPVAHPATTAPAARPYPSDYARAILTAWRTHDTAYLTLLTDASTASQLYGYGDIDQTWTGRPGSGAAGSTYWEFFNNAGDWLILRTGNEATGAHQWHAGRVSVWDRMSFPDDAVVYVKRFIDAWTNGNTARMKLLSSAGTTSTFTGMSPVPDQDYTAATAPDGDAAGHSYVEVKEPSVSLDVVIGVANLFLGDRHAIESCVTGC